MTKNVNRPGVIALMIVVSIIAFMVFAVKEGRREYKSPHGKWVLTQTSHDLELEPTGAALMVPHVPIAHLSSGRFLAVRWVSDGEIEAVISRSASPTQFGNEYGIRVNFRRQAD